MLERYAYILFINYFNHLSRYKLSFDLVESRPGSIETFESLSIGEDTFRDRVNFRVSVRRESDEKGDT